MTTITIGAGRLNAHGRRVDVEDLADFMEQLPVEEDGWISGLVWVGDRRLGSHFESAGVLFVDADHYVGEGFVHGPTTAEARAELEAIQLACSGWHHTPRGFRAWFVIDRQITDPAEYQTTLEAAQRAINDALEAGNILGKRGEAQGYRADGATLDLARWMFRPHCIVDGVERKAQIHRSTPAVWSVDAVRRLGSGAITVAREILSRMPAAGPGDGSLELIRACRRALSLGIDTFEDFQRAASGFGTRWSEDDMRKRWDAAKARWLSEGRVTVPVNDKGKPVYSLAILQDILTGDRKYRDKLRRNELDMRVLFGARPLDDEHVTDARIDLERRYGLRVPKDDAHDVVRAVAAGASFSPVAEWLRTLRWDGRSRTKEIVEGVLGGSSTGSGGLAEIYLRRWGIGAVARALRPGCKMDNVLMLVGAQGVGKSSFFRGLVGGEWFADTFLDLSSKDGFLQILGSWVYELSELEALYRKVDVSRLRAVLTSVEDRFRAPYERSVKSHARRMVFVASANGLDALQDPEGSRRFWGLEVLRVDQSLLADLREGYWAECLDAFVRGEPWWLTPEEDARRAAHNARFERDNPLVDRIVELVDGLVRPDGTLPTAVLLARLGYPTGEAGPAVLSALSIALGRRGFRRELGGVWRRLAQQ